MKISSNIRTILLSFLFLTVTSSMQQVHAQPGITVSFQQFYDELSPYGEWVDDPEYGYIWIPNAEPDFQPYATNGRWVMTDYGNTWVSNYDWGWGPFHYGRWNYHNRFGWSWVPGYEWGPAWVNWRTGGGYYGWAPLGPGMNIGVSVNIPTNYWVFVPQRYLLSTSIHRYYAPRRNVVNFYNRTTIINNTYVYNNRSYVSGPRRSDIQRVTRTTVPVHRISDASRPGSSRVTGRSVEIYRPNVSRNEQARPSRVTASNNVRAANSNGSRSTSGSRSNTPRPNGTNRSNERVNNSRTPATSTRTQSGNRATSSTSRSRPTSNTKAADRDRTSTNAVPSRQSGSTSERTATPRVNRPNTNRSGNTGNSRTERPTPQRTESAKPQRTERAAPQRTETPTPQRTQGSSPRTERSTPQRTERPTQQRIERPSSSSSPRSSSPRGSEGSSRPSRSTRG